MTAPELDRAGVIARNVGVGCVTTVAGFFGGGMIAVFIGKVVGSAQGCKPPEGLPACNWWVYAGIGAVLGALILPVVVLIRLNQARPGK
ncbi:MAG TPA: hypothetical protein VGO33_02235 [Gemmatimonadaceae bacterium]|jgi:hypothetical protein|nr:hypothetical protein [Gemmatimonadaceae bacterium]